MTRRDIRGSAPPEERTLTGLTLLLQSNALRTALGAYTLDGPYGRLLDAAEQHLVFADVQCFETEALMGQAGVVAPVLNVVATVRGSARTRLHELADEHAGRIAIETLDVTQPDQTAALRGRLSGRSFDILFVNAGTANMKDETVADIPADEFARMLVTNALSPMRVHRRIAGPGQRRRPDRRDVVGSGQHQRQYERPA